MTSAALWSGFLADLMLPALDVNAQIAQRDAALAELRKELRESGVLDAGERRQWLNPLWRRMSGGCNLELKIDALTGSASFRLVEFSNEYAKGQHPMSYAYHGCARQA